MGRHRYTSVSSDEPDLDGSFHETTSKLKKSHRRLVLNLCSALIIFLAGAGFGLVAARSVEISHAKSTSTLIPKFSRVEKVFEADYRYWNLTDPAASRAWAEIVPSGGIVVEHPEDYGLEPGIPLSPTVDRMIMTGTHQIHCLKVLRSTFVAMLTGQPMHGHHQFRAHPDHCFDYLRQTLTCNPSFTIEKARVDADGKRRATDGWGVAHECVKFEEVETWLRENRELERSHSEWKAAYDSDPLPQQPMQVLPKCTWPEQER